MVDLAKSTASTSAGRQRAAKRSARPARGENHSKPKKRVAPKAKASPAKARKGAARTKAKAPAARRSKPRATQAKAPSRRKARNRGRFLDLILITGFVVLLLGGVYRLWFRDSSFVAASKITVAGAAGPQATEIDAALTRTGKGMSTLHIDQEALDAAVARFPTVAAVSAAGDFPHGLTITVIPRPPVLIARSAGQEVAVAADGILLRGVELGGSQVPKLRVDRLPANGRLTGGPLEIAKVVGAAPAPLAKLIDGARFQAKRGVVINLHGLSVIFGGSDRAAEKWAAVAATLADPSLDTIGYLDVRIPARPAAGDTGETVEDAPDSSTIAAQTAALVPPATDPAASEPTVAPATPSVADPSTDPTVVAPSTDSAASTPATSTPTPTPPATPATASPDPGATTAAGGGATTGGVAP